MEKELQKERQDITSITRINFDALCFTNESPSSQYIDCQLIL